MKNLAAALSVTALALAGTAVAVSPADAKPIEKGHFTESFTTDPYDCDGLLMAQDEVDARISFLVNQRGSSPFPYFADHFHATVVTTNLATGGTYTQIYRNNTTDHTIVDNGDGTITITVRAAGGTRYYDQFGNFVQKDPGTVWFSFAVDYGGTPSDPSDDTDVEDSFEIVRPSTGNSDFADRSFCEDVLTFTSD